MRAVLVVDIDYSCGWGPEAVRDSLNQQKVAEELKNFLQKEREKRNIIAFVTFPYNTSGQEFQLETAPFKISSLFSRARKCLICDRDNGRLAEFLKHRHGTEFEAAFVKTDCDAFTNQALGAYFHSKNVKEILLAGLFNRRLRHVYSDRSGEGGI